MTGQPEHRRDTPAAAAPLSTAVPRPTEDQLVRENLALVGYVVSEFVAKLPSHISRDELSSAGMYALAAAARGWDPERGVPFARFATTRIRGAIIDELRGMDWASRSVRGRARKVDAARTQLTATLGRSPSPAEIATATGMTVAELDGVEEDVQRAVVLSLHGSPGDATEELVADRMPSPEDELLLRERIGYLRDAIDALPERLRKVVVDYFFTERPMAEIAKDLGVTESRVSHLRAEALAQLRDGMNSQLDPQLVAPAERPGGCVDRRRAAYFAEIAAQGDLRSRLERRAVGAQAQPAETSRTA
jgi:RNA polymerase sigma factor for flagellar operon FliA